MKPFLPMLALCALLAACAAPETGSGFDRPALLERLPAAIAMDIGRADRHILVVRHARKIAPDCNALDCPLSSLGTEMTAKLADLIGAPPVDEAFSSAACRTLRTAEAGGQTVTVHQAADGLETGCTADERVTRSRADAFAEAAASQARWTLVAEHSNTSCLWLAEFAGEAASQAAGCTDGRLEETAYGDVFWLYRLDDAWQIAVLPAAFEIMAAD